MTMFDLEEQKEVFQYFRLNFGIMTTDSHECREYLEEKKLKT